MKPQGQRDMWTPVFIAALFIIAMVWEGPVSMNGWVNKVNATYKCIYNGMLCSLIYGLLSSALTWMIYILY